MTPEDLHRLALKAAHKYAIDPQDAEDVAGEVCVSLLRSSTPLEEVGSTLVYRVAQQRAIDLYRWKSRRPAGELNEGAVAGPERPAEALDTLRAARIAEEAVESLTPYMQRIWEVVLVGGGKPVDVARERGVAPNAARIALQRLRARLRARLHEAGYER